MQKFSIFFRSKHKSMVKINRAFMAIGLATVVPILWIGLAGVLIGRTLTTSPTHTTDLLSTIQTTANKTIISGANIIPGGEIAYRVEIGCLPGFRNVIISDTLPNATGLVSPSLAIRPDGYDSGYDRDSRTVYFRAQGLSDPIGTLEEPIVITFSVKTTDSQPLTATVHVTNVARIDVPSMVAFPDTTNVVTSTLNWPTNFLPLAARNLCQQDRYEPNNNRSEAEANVQAHIDVPDMIDDAWFCPGDVNDYYRFEFSDKAISIQLSPPSQSDFDLWVYDAAGDVIKGSATIGNGRAETVVLNPGDTAPGIHYVRVFVAALGETDQQPYRLALAPD